MLRAFGLYTHIRSNAIKSVIVLLIFPFLLPTVIFIAGIIIGAVGRQPVDRIITGAGIYAFMVLAVVGVVMVLWVPIAYLINQWIIDKATGARPITRSEEYALWNLLENLCISRGLAMPALRIIENDALNAFASGVSARSYSITVTRGLLDNLDSAEIEGVLAHELTHIRNRDVQLLIMTSIIVGVAPLACDLILLFWRGLMFVCFLPLKALGAMLPGLGQQISIIQAIQNSFVFLFAFLVRLISEFLSLIMSLFLSRRREYMADAGAVELTKNPEAMISALRKVAGHSDVPTSIASVREMFFDNPRISGFEGLFATHPPIEKRIDALIRYARDVHRPVVALVPVVNSRDAGFKPPHILSASLKASKEDAPARRTTADYYPLVSRAVAALGDKTDVTRTEVYERAVGALRRNLETATPAFTEAEVELEVTELIAVTRRVEAQFGGGELRAMRDVSDGSWQSSADDSAMLSRSTAYTARSRFARVGITMLVATSVLAASVVGYIFLDPAYLPPAWRNPVVGAAPPRIADYPWNLEKSNPTAIHALRRIIPVQFSSVDWVYNLNGTAEELTAVTRGSATYIAGWICKPHDCGDNKFTFLISTDGSRAIGLVKSVDLGGKRFFGNPNSDEMSFLDGRLR